MYELPSASLMYKDKSTKSFPTTRGLKNGDILSTVLFNLYIDDIPSVLDDTSKEKGKYTYTCKYPLKRFNFVWKMI